jgi:hypothetical protein
MLTMKELKQMTLEQLDALIEKNDKEVLRLDSELDEDRIYILMAESNNALRVLSYRSS